MSTVGLKSLPFVAVIVLLSYNLQRTSRNKIFCCILVSNFGSHADHSFYYRKFYIYGTRITLRYKRLSVFHCTSKTSAQNSIKTRYQIRTVVERKHRAVERYIKCIKKTNNNNNFQKARNVYTSLKMDRTNKGCENINWVEPNKERSLE